MAHGLRSSVSMTVAATPWTCPFCPLACDHVGVAAGQGGVATLVGSDCPRAIAALSSFAATPSSARPSVRNRRCDLGVAVAQAARLLRASRQPLFGGLGTDVAGARSLYALACATGAICDAAGGPALMQGVRALQDRGGFFTTVAELRTRADVVLCFGALPTPRYPEFLHRAGLSADDARLLVVGAGGDDLFDAAATLAALLEGRAAPNAPASLRGAAKRLLAAQYAVIVYEPAQLGEHGALVIEMLHRMVATLNSRTRAAAFVLGGGDGAATVNQVFAWLSGLPLRTRAGAHGLEHEPLCFDAERLCKEGSIDLLLWLASFGGEAPMPPTAKKTPRIVIGHPVLADGQADVFIPVATPGIGSDGHLFRTDGVVLMPLHAWRADTLPSAAQVLRDIARALETSTAQHA
jgi:formylmethanofuran dehydrogenase subunit B